MRLRWPYDAVGTALRNSCRPCIVVFQLNAPRPFSASASRPIPNQRAKDIAVVGGGITGLATAYNLSRDLPNARITLYESSHRLGGWLESEKIEVDGGYIFFDYGPRTLRVDSRKPDILRLIALLGLQDAVCPISKNAPASRNRYLYYPDHLVRMPGPLPGASTLMTLVRNVSGLFTEPVFKGVLWALFNDVRNEPRNKDVGDESIGDFFSRRFSPDVANNLVSAVFHGIFAGDIYQLSMRSILGMFWALEMREEHIVGSYLEAAWGNTTLPVQKYETDFREAIAADDLDQEQWLPVRETMGSASVFTFQKGVGQLSHALESALRQAPNVKIMRSAPVKEIRAAKGSENLLVTAGPGGTTSKYNYVVSTIPPSGLYGIRGQEWSRRPDQLRAVGDWVVPGVNVMVVNLYYSDPFLVPVVGFGYLIPQSVPFDENPERALGAIFASESSVGQDTAPGTKLTVMLGGHYWNGWDDLPNEESGIKMAQAVLLRHLGVAQKPIVAKARLQKNAIPQYRPYHYKRMAKVHDQLLGQYGGRLRVAGNSYHGVGINDCLASARRASYGIREGTENSTSLEHFGQPDEWKMVSRQGQVTTIRLD